MTYNSRYLNSPSEPPRNTEPRHPEGIFSPAPSRVEVYKFKSLKSHIGTYQVTAFYDNIATPSKLFSNIHDTQRCAEGFNIPIYWDI